MFQLVQDRSQAQRLRQAPDCVKDPWTLHMQEKHADWGSTEFQHILLLHWALGTTNISQIEVRHASVRRHLVAKSTQVKRMRFQSVGAEWVCQQVRRWKLQSRVAQNQGEVLVGMTKQLVSLERQPPPFNLAVLPAMCKLGLHTTHSEKSSQDFLCNHNPTR